MILVGFLCVLGAIGLLVAGLAQAEPDLVWASITASALGGLAVGVAAFQRGRALRRGEPGDEAAHAAPVATTGTTQTSTQRWPPRRTAEAAGETARPPTPTPQLTQGAPETPAPDVDGRAGAEPPRTKTAAFDAADTDADADDDSETGEDEADDSETGEDEADDSETGEDPADDSETGEDPADEPGEEEVDMADLLLIVDLREEVLVVDLRPRYHLAMCGHLDGREAIPLPVHEAREDGFTPCGLCRPDASLAGRARRLTSGDT